MTSKEEILDNKQILHSFGKWLMGQNKSDGTIKTYVGVISQFLQWFKDEAEEIEKFHVQTYLDDMEQSNKSGGTIEKHYSAITMFSRFLDKPEIVLNIDRKAKEKKEDPPKALNMHEQAALLKEIEASGHFRNIAIVYTMIHTGIRVSELCDLNHSDIQKEGERQYILIRDSKGDIDRKIPLSMTASEKIKAYKEFLNMETEAIFISSVNQRITPRSVQYMLTKYNTTPHRLRNTFCQTLIDKGIDLQTVSKLMGHKDLNMTKRYIGEGKEELESAIENTFDNL
ncbi:MULTISPECIES: tyrosine-type recombinase/integrase [unclassified Bacillus (in: firmicutes)]|uniref:tyrosine-type recombinase/integrase n=1 Tax=unclassified Bacillus (in: firmicutes) TaxID=185979 RepID=UPI001BEA6394|nr:MULTISPECIES: tyrosine-type recombinase/integrase [unclassified Bacillus (in: firmicutes)]MBT2615764.1 tyrosine-type recombinase/integrase [Bacillus sp. ISL-78]MBT2630484.1 tyrosine-type recombinase/integrase [Bacillus sp. ISL-101]MBT2714352.1 tyrosine-type recombinase/integrase [Bacillus sp. ISL-57]